MSTTYSAELTGGAAPPPPARWRGLDGTLPTGRVAGRHREGRMEAGNPDEGGQRLKGEQVPLTTP